jgi:hypothetical protein
MPNDTRATRRATVHLSLQFVSLFSLILSLAAGYVDIGTFFGILINVTTDDDGLVVRTLCDRGPILFKYLRSDQS